MAFDLMSTSSLMQTHAAEGLIVADLDLLLLDAATGRRKHIDMAIARARGRAQNESRTTLSGLVHSLGVVLNDVEISVLEALPELRLAPAGAIMAALQAKACMTAHVQSLSRIYAELDAFHWLVHGASRQALAIGYVQVNAAHEFLSPVANSGRVELAGAQVSRHKQPGDTVRVLDKVAEIPRRSASSEVGFDAIGVTVLDVRNDGSPVRVVTGPPAPQPGAQFHYGSMIVRMANEYDTVFGQI